MLVKMLSLLEFYNNKSNIQMRNSNDDNDNDNGNDRRNNKYKYSNGKYSRINKCEYI